MALCMGFPCQCEEFYGAEVCEQLCIFVALNNRIAIGTNVPGSTFVRSASAADADLLASAFTATALSEHINPTAASTPACPEPLIDETTLQPTDPGGGSAAAIPSQRSPRKGLLPTPCKDLQNIAPAPLQQEQASGSSPPQQGLPLCIRLRMAREGPPQVLPEPVLEPVLWVGKQLSGKHRRTRQRENR